MEKTELILICLVAVALLAIVARKIRVPYPILLTIGGVVLALIPGLPAIHLEPKLVFNLFLPPLLYPAAIFTSWRDFRMNLRSILPLAIVLVLLTMTATAYLFHDLVGLPLAVGFVFGAIISPPDAVAALAVTQNLRVPRKIIVILEGESLVNDATSFISFRFAVAAVMTGTFSLAQASLQFLFVAAGGICVGLAVGWLVVQLQKRLDDPPVQTLFSLLTPYVAYFSGENLHVSGILAVVIAGIYIGWRAPRIMSGRMRLQAFPVWEMVTFILNGILFMLIGLQLPQVMGALAPGTATRAAQLAIVFVLMIVLVRFAWVFGATYLPRLLSPTFRRTLAATATAALPTTLNAANSQNVAELPIAPTRDRKNWLTRNADPQLTAVQTATARPRTRPKKISLMTVQTTGPSENANETMKATRPSSVTIPATLGAEETDACAAGATASMN